MHFFEILIVYRDSLTQSPFFLRIPYTGIPPEDLKDHERQKTGAKSESDEEEPVIKKNKPDIAAPPPNMMMPNMMPPHMMAQYGMPPFMPMMPPQMMPPQMMPPQMMPRPLFPAASNQHQMAPPKPTFPAYRYAEDQQMPSSIRGSARPMHAVFLCFFTKSSAFSTITHRWFFPAFHFSREPLT